jgi:STE24 endopeptidase
MTEFDPAAATAALIDGLGAETLERAAAYTIGNHWILFGGTLVSLLIAWIVIRLGWLDRLQARLGQRVALAAFLVSALWLLLAGLLGLPWSIWTDWWRETQFGRTTQPFADWFLQGAIALLLSVVIGGLFFAALYWLIRRTGPRWWLWGGGLAAAAITLLLLLSPILIEPIFNQYQPLPDGPVRDRLEVQAARAGVPGDRIFVYDGSRQSENFTANVSGVFGTARIAISDVALKGADIDEVEAVTGHEIGHYVLHHIWQRVALFAGLALLGFFLAGRLFPLAARLLGSTARIDEPRGLPVLMAILSVLGLFAVPFTNALSRLGEWEADRYSLETVKKPEALATALVKTAEYRDPRPHPVQEAIFYTHPSVERRVMAAMEWKAANPPG